MGKIVSLNNEKITQKYQKRHAKIAWNLAKFFAKTIFKSTLKKMWFFENSAWKILKLYSFFRLKNYEKYRLFLLSFVRIYLEIFLLFSLYYRNF